MALEEDLRPRGDITTNLINSKNKIIKARFICDLTIYWPNGKLKSARGVINGSISKEMKGLKGFGYDPIFKIKNSCQTLAEVSFEERMKISHRAKSTQEMLKHLNRLYK